MRSWLQPGLYVLLVRGAESLGVTDPFRQALVLRGFSGLLYWTALLAFTRSAWLWCPAPTARRMVVRLTWLSFFVPYLAVRTSSESLATMVTLAVIPNRPDIGFQRFVYRRWPDSFGAVLLDSDSPWAQGPLDRLLASERHALIICPAFDRPTVRDASCEALYRPYPEWLRGVERLSPRWHLPGHGLYRCRHL